MSLLIGNGKWDLEKTVVERFMELQNRVEAIFILQKLSCGGFGVCSFSRVFKN